MIFAILTLLSALSLAAVAGWFSIAGFMTIYAGAPLYALVMGIVTECAKLVTTSWLYRNWNISSWKLKIPLLYFTIALMVITSIGVFGFLSKAHIEQGADKIDNSAKIENLQFQIDREKARVADNQKIIDQLDATVNSFIGRDRADRALSVRRSQAEQRRQLQRDSTEAQKRIDVLNEEKFKLESEIRKLQLEVGPIRYIAELIYGVDENANKNIESAIRIFTLLIVSTLDPLAVVLLIAANHTLMRLKDEKEKTKASKEGTNEESPEDKKSTLIENNIPDIPENTDLLAKNSENDNRTIIPDSKMEEHVQHTSVDEKIYHEEADLKIENSSNQLKDENQDMIMHVASKILDDNKPLGRIKTPDVSMIDENTSENISERTSAIKEEIKHNTENKNIPWAQQDFVLREILGNSPHFNPQKVIDSTNQNIDIIKEDPENLDKYPSIQSWLKEFRGSKNE